MRREEALPEESCLHTAFSKNVSGIQTCKPHTFSFCSSEVSGSLETMFSNIAGVIHQEEQDRFARMLFRATRGSVVESSTCMYFCKIISVMAKPTAIGTLASAIPL